MLHDVNSRNGKMIGLYILNCAVKPGNESMYICMYSEI